MTDKPAHPDSMPRSLTRIATGIAALIASAQGLAADAVAAGGYVPQVDAGKHNEEPWIPEGFTLTENPLTGELSLAHTSHRSHSSHSSHSSHASGSAPRLPRTYPPYTPSTPSAPSSPSTPAKPLIPATPATPKDVPSKPADTQPFTAPTILEALAKTYKHEILLDAIKTAGLEGQLRSSGSMTLLAPTDEAFRQLSTKEWDNICQTGHKDALAKLLRVHILNTAHTTTGLKTTTTVKTVDGKELPVESQGSKVSIGGARVLDAEQKCSNGTLLQTDRVLLNNAGNLMAVMDTRGYSTMAGLFRTAGMDSILWGSMPYTILVPSEEAFKKLPPDTLDRLRKPENREELKTLLNHHLVRGRCSSKALVEGKKIKLNDGSELAVSPVSGLLEIGGVLVSMPDDEASNGFIHRLDAVLMPVKP